MSELLFKDTTKALSFEEAQLEASKCLQCKSPKCVEGCPLHNNIPAFIKCIKEADFAKGNQILEKTSIFGSICSRVCAQENQCEGNCIQGIKGSPIKIGQLEKFLTSQNVINETPVSLNGYNVAIIGAGPSGLSCAYTLAKNGYKVTIYESFNKAGGELRYGIPSFRLEKEVVDNVINRITALGVTIIYNTFVGKDISLEELRNKYDYVYIANGAKAYRLMGIEGENLEGIYDSSSFLLNVYNSNQTNNNEYYNKFQNVVIVGGGNSAIDAARTAKRLNPNTVTIVYRRSEKEMPCRKKEIEEALNEDILLLTLTNPVKAISSDGKSISEIECLRMTLGEPDQSGRRRPIEISNSNFRLKCDCLIMALGNVPDKTFSNDVSNDKNYIIVDENCRTSIPNVFAGGDTVTGSATVVKAIKSGRNAADKIINMNK